MVRSIDSMDRDVIIRELKSRLHPDTEFSINTDPNDETNIIVVVDYCLVMTLHVSDDMSAINTYSRIDIQNRDEICDSHYNMKINFNRLSNLKKCIDTAQEIYSEFKSLCDNYDLI